jgi:hypothetical protein
MRTCRTHNSLPTNRVPRDSKSRQGALAQSGLRAGVAVAVTVLEDQAFVRGRRENRVCPVRFEMGIHKHDEFAVLRVEVILQFLRILEILRLKSKVLAIISMIEIKPQNIVRRYLSVEFG